MKKIRVLRVLLTGLIFAIIAQIINSLGAYMTMSYYLLKDYFPVWSKLMMPAAGPPPVYFFVLSFVFNFVIGALFALVYTLIKTALPKPTWLRGLYYGLLVFLVGGIPGYFAMVLLINLPFGLVLFWAVESLFTDLVNGLVTAGINK
jgi:hypothetical protein